MIKAENKPLHLKVGYLLSVESWENDGDNYSTQHKFFDTLEEAELAVSIVKLFAEQNGNESNYDNFDASAFNVEQIKYVVGDVEITEDDDEDNLLDYFSDFVYSYLGSSEYYSCRVYDKHVIRKIPVDVMLEVVSHGRR